MITLEYKLSLIYSEDDFEYDADLLSSVGRECLICHKPFYPIGKNSSRQQYCKRSHYVNCLICGTPVKQVPPSCKSDFIRCTCSRECATKLKMQETRKAIKEKYGVDNISQCAEFKDKISAGIKAKSAESTKKTLATMKERYGGIGTASPILRKKIESTMQDRYGVKNPSYSEEIKKKISEINSSPEVIAKYEATAIARWNVNRPSKTTEIQQKMKNTSLERYGVECTLQTEFAKQRLKKVSLEKYGVENPLESDYAREKARLGFISTMQDSNHKISKLNQQAAEYFKEFGIETEFEKYIGRKQFDLAVIGSNVLIEINPSYTHSNLPNHWNASGLDSNYHLEKSRVAEEAGYRCIHIFDWDNPAKIAKMLLPKQTVYARNCSIQRVEAKQIRSFIDANHIQGDVKGAQFCYVLIYKGQTVSAMTFGKPRYNKNYEWELLRLCTDSKYRIVGGASKMFKQFLKDADPNSILSYCDKAKFTGQVYAQIGMKLHHISPPAKVWSKEAEYITDNYLRQRGFDQIFRTSFGKGTSNEALMIEHGWRSVFDCGQMVFEWISDDHKK